MGRRPSPRPMPWCTREWQPQGRGGGRPKPSRWVCCVEGGPTPIGGWCGEAMCMYMYMYVCWTFRVVIVKACTEQSQEMHTFKVWFLCFTCAKKTLIFSKVL